LLILATVPLWFHELRVLYYKLFRREQA